MRRLPALDGGIVIVGQVVVLVADTTPDPDDRSRMFHVESTAGWDEPVRLMHGHDAPPGMASDACGTVGAGAARQSTSLAEFTHASSRCEADDVTAEHGHLGGVAPQAVWSTVLMVARSVREERRDLARVARRQGKTWVAIADRLRAQWPDLTPRAALRMAHCWTQQDVADAWSRRFDGRAPEGKEISRWEVWPGTSGVRPSLDTLDKLAQLYECSISDLLTDISDYRDRDPNNPAFVQRAGQSVVVQMPEQRVEVLGGLPDSAPGVTGALAAGRAPGAGPLDVTAIRAMSDAFRAADRRLGGGVLYGSVTRYLNAEVAPLLLTPTSHAPDAQLFTAAASLTEAAGWMAHDGGSDEIARRHFTRAFKLASVADSSALIANVCASMSHLASQLGENHHAIRLADKGLEHTAQVPSAAQLVARLHAMRALALAGQNDVQTCRRALAQAERSLAAVDAHDLGWVSHFDEASLAIETAMCLHRLGDARHAEVAAQRAIDLRSGDRVRSRTFAQITLARVLAAAGRIDEAASIGTTVCEVAATLASTRVVHELDDLMAALANHSSLDEVGDFRAALDALHESSQPPAEPSPWPT